MVCQQGKQERCPCHHPCPSRHPGPRQLWHPCPGWDAPCHLGLFLRGPRPALHHVSRCDSRLLVRNELLPPMHPALYGQQAYAGLPLNGAPPPLWHACRMTGAVLVCRWQRLQVCTAAHSWSVGGVASADGALPPTGLCCCCSAALRLQQLHWIKYPVLQLCVGASGWSGLKWARP